MASRLEGKVVTISKRVGDENRLFGSVTGSDIAAALEKEGIALDRRNIVLADAIKALGEYKVTVKAGYQTTAQVQVLVVPETIGDQQ